MKDTTAISIQCLFITLFMVFTFIVVTDKQRDIYWKLYEVEQHQLQLDSLQKELERERAVNYNLQKYFEKK